MYLCTAMRFIVPWGMELKLGMRIEHRPIRFESIFLEWPNQRSKVIQRSSCFTNALWPSNLVGKTPDKRVIYAGVKGHAEVNRGQLGVKLLKNALWRPNKVGRTPDRRVMLYWGQRSCSGQKGSFRGQIAQECPMDTTFCGKNSSPPPQWSALMGSIVMQGSAQRRSTRCHIVKEFSMATKFGRENPWPKNNHCCGQRSCGVSWGSTGSQVAQKCPIEMP